jgi:beta-glucosidase
MDKFFPEQTLAVGAFFAAALVVFSPSTSVVAQPEAPQPERVTTAPSESPAIAPDAPFTEKVKQLVAQLTVDEKISLVHGQRPLPADQDLGQAGYTPGIPRLGIPGRKDADAVGISVFAETTAPPTKIAIAASFDRSAAQALGELEGLEGRAVGIDLIYGPQLDIARFPGASRNQTTAGEDPYLIGELGVSEIHGIQGKGLLSEPKHFALYNQSTNNAAGAAQLNVNADQQTLHEIYLAPFDAAVTRALASSLMCSYNKSFGQYSCEQPLLLSDVLRGQWGFEGFVLSDYGATHSLSILQGLDTSFPGGLGPDGSPFFTTDLRALTDPASPRYNTRYAEALDTAVARILYQYERFGLLRKPLGARPVLDRRRGQTTALDLAQRSAVLLKNADRILPLSTADLESVVVIGPTARQLYVGVGGERSRGFADRDAISPLMALQNYTPAGTKVSYVPGIDWLGEVVPASALGAGLTRTQSDATIAQVDATLDYSGPKTLQPGVTYTWTGTLTAPATDTYNLQLQRSATSPILANPAAIGAVTLDVDAVRRPVNSPVPGGPVPIIMTPDGLYNVGAAIHLTAGTHAIKITYSVPPRIAAPLPAAGSASPANLRFMWSAVSQGIAAAANAAKHAKIAVVFTNDSPGGNATLDRDPATLQAGQDDLIAAVAAANPNTIVVLNTGSPVTMPWISSVKAILEMWLPGQEGGTATANLLLGKAVPGGKLPITFPADVTPLTDHPERFPGVDARGVAALTGPTTETYTEGIFVGYRWYDENHVNPLFPFGHGLSYTAFTYSGLQVSKASDGGLNVHFRLTNTGTMEGDEVPQVYLGRPAAPLPAGVQFAPSVLAGFTRVHLGPSQSTDITIHVAPRQLSYWSVANGSWVVATGDRTVSVGSSSRDVRLTALKSVR